MNIILFFIIVTIIFFIKFKITKVLKKKKTKKSISKQQRKYKPKNNKSQYNNLYKKKIQKTTYAEKQKKGQEYEKYISEYFKEKGYVSYEHGLEKGFKDGGIDLFLKKDKEYLFIQCKNWNKNHKWKMGKKKIIYYQEKAREYMKKNPRISRLIIDFNYKIKLIFVSTEDIYTQEAKEYIKENSHILEYQIIPMQ